MKKATEWIANIGKQGSAWFVDRVQHHRVWIVLGVLWLLVELALFLGTGVLQEDEEHFLTGEGSWGLEMSGADSQVRQTFVPAFARLQSVSFSMDMTRSVHGDGTVRVAVEDAAGVQLFETAIPFYEVVNCSFTDVTTDLELRRGDTYVLVIEAQTPYADETPFLSVCGKEYALAENKDFAAGTALEGQQLVTRYHYADAVTGVRVRNAILLSVLTALGVMFGLPGDRRFKRLVSVLLLVAAPYILGKRLELLNYDPAFYLPFSMKWNLGIMYALELVVLLVSHSPAIATVVTNIALTALYTANYFMRMYRGTSLRMNDFTAIGTATKVVGAYDLTPNSHVTMAWAILALIVVWSLRTIVLKREKKQIWNTWWAYAVTIALAAALLFAGGHKLLYTDYLDEVGFANKGISGFTYELIYSFDGYLVATCIEVKNARIVPPEGYSIERVEEILETAVEQDVKDAQVQADAADYPHVILIMNESLADLTVLDGVELSEDNLPFIHSLQENTVKGYVNTSVFGGGTANSEFEVFTGCNMAFFSVNYYPYQQAIRKPVNSMVSRMKENGYTTISMHPERPGNWNRENIYRYYGFGQSYWKQDFPDASVIHSGVSDAATYDKIIELYEQRKAGEKLFVFDLTMQNHGGYTMHDVKYNIQALNIRQPQVDEYLSLVKISDTAFQGLVEYFEKQDEKVIICMYGDHQPWVSDFLVSANLRDGNEVSEQILSKYKTPLVIWANYDIDEVADCNFSLNYLGGYLMRTAGVPMSPYFLYLEQLRQTCPIITINGYVDADGVYAGWSGEKDEFPEYRMLQHNYLYDDHTVMWGF